MLVALLTHFSLKANNALAPRLAQATGQDFFHRLVCRSPLGFVGLGVAVTLMVTAALSWDQELEADSESASRLHLHEAAIQLKEEQLIQARVHERLYGATPLLDRDMEHPPTALQLYALNKSIKRKT